MASSKLDIAYKSCIAPINFENTTSLNDPSQLSIFKSQNSGSNYAFLSPTPSQSAWSPIDVKIVNMGKGVNFK